jgi:superfamily II DNA or RNA helicase
MRMRALMDFKTKETYARNLLNSLENKCLVFCNTQEQADRVCKHSYHANNSDSEQNLIDFKDGTIDKLSCVMQLNEGVNIPNLKSGIILHAYSNERKSNQRIGRLLRLNPDETATIHILMYSGTVDESWIHQALNDLDPKKIIYTEKIIF